MQQHTIFTVSFDSEFAENTCARGLAQSILGDTFGHLFDGASRFAQDLSMRLKCADEEALMTWLGLKDEGRIPAGCVLAHRAI